MNPVISKFNNRKFVFHISSVSHAARFQHGIQTKRHVSNKPNSGGTADPALYCRDQVQKHDYEGYLTCFAYPSAKRNSYFALKAFNVELAMIPDSTSQATIAKMGLQFWKDAITSIQAGNPPQHPIALALRPVLSVVPAYHLNRIISARVSEITDSGFMTLDQVTKHAEATSSTLLYSLLSLLGLSSSSLYSHAASHIGTAAYCATILRALPFQASKRRLFIPAEITAKHGVSQEDVFRQGGSARGVEDAVFELATIAAQHMNTARQMFEGGKVPEEALPVFLSAIPTASYLTRLESYNFDAFEPKLQIREWKLPYLLWKANRNQTF